MSTTFRHWDLNIFHIFLVPEALFVEALPRCWEVNKLSRAQLRLLDFTYFTWTTFKFFKTAHILAVGWITHIFFLKLVYNVPLYIRDTSLYSIYFLKLIQSILDLISSGIYLIPSILIINSGHMIKLEYHLWTHGQEYHIWTHGQEYHLWAHDLTRIPHLDTWTRIPPLFTWTRIPHLDTWTRIPPLDTWTRIPPLDTWTRIPPLDTGTRKPPQDTLTRIQPLDTWSKPQELLL